MSGLDLQYVADLVTQAQEGDSNAFAELFAATYQKQYAFARSYLHDDFLAQQALQSAYIQALKSLFRLREPGLVVPWLNQLTLLACVDLQNQYAHTAGLSDDRQLNIDGRMYSMRQILTLPFSEAQTILLSRLCGMKTGAIASLLEIRRSDVRRYMQSGSRRIRALASTKDGEQA